MSDRHTVKSIILMFNLYFAVTVSLPNGEFGRCLFVFIVCFFHKINQMSSVLSRLINQ